MAFIMSWHDSEDGDGADAAPGRLAAFRRELYWCLGMRRDALFDACNALACNQGRVLMLGGCAWSRSAAAGTAASMTH